MVCETGSRPGYGMKATMMGRQFRMSRSRDLAMVMVLLSIGLLLLAGGAGAQVFNMTRNAAEDGEVLQLLKAGIISDPFNVTYWWKVQGAATTLNPCRTRPDNTPSYWTGINCTDRRVSSINLANMSLTGTLTPELARLPFLRSLDLSNNSFMGQIPQGLGSLQSLDLSNNQLVGGFPPSFGNWTNLTSLDLSNNRLTGPIPASISRLQLLETLNISRNNFTGEIPAELNQCVGLTRLDLSRNALQGTIPSLSRLTTLNLQGNKLQNFPESLGNWTSLSSLDLSENALVGTIPASIGSLLLLESLNMSSNMLNGTIPTELNSCKKLNRIDLSRNALLGGVPFQDLTELRVIRLHGNGLTGNLSDSVQSLLNLQELDLSYNHFSGPIPGMKLKDLPLVSFNVSHNDFTGELPLFRGVKSLKVFDAAKNNLHGPVPEEFVDFDALTFLNVSYNRLTGELPRFRGKEGVNSDSFLGMEGLCGGMLRKRCQRGKDDRKQELIAIVVGCSVAFVTLFFVALFCCNRSLRHRKQHKKFSNVSAELRLKLNPEQVLRATHNFHDLSKIGEGNVYRGVLPDDTCVAVKKLVAVRVVNEGTEQIFGDAFEVLSHIRHWSLVKVLGYCISPDATALVMEYMPNGNLNTALYSQQPDSEVTREFNWHQRFTTAVGIAEGLKYLHHDCTTPTVHGNLKPNNILFNIFMEPRIADFGIAKILDDQGIKGGATNLGYQPPEAGNMQDLSIKGDVYTFGIIMLEMMTGRSPQSLEAGVSLPEWIRTTLLDAKELETILDPVLRSEHNANKQKMSMALGVALLCTREQPNERPYMTEVLKMLNHIKTRPQDETKSSKRFKSSPSTHKRNEEIRHEVPGIEIAPSPPTTPGTAPPTPPHTLTVQQTHQDMQQGMHTLSHNPSLSAWTPSPDNR